MSEFDPISYKKASKNAADLLALAGAGRTNETVKDNADDITTNTTTLAAIANQLNTTSATAGQVLTVQSDGSLAYADASDGALIINPNHVFADNTARDAYFGTNPTELVEEIFISVGAGFQQYLSSAWVDKTAVVLAELDTVTADNVDDTVITPLKNIIVNADLADLTTGWSDQYATLTESAGVLVVTQDASRNSFKVQNTTTHLGVLAHKVYVTFKYRISDASGMTYFQAYLGATAVNLTQTANEWITFSNTYTLLEADVGAALLWKIQCTYTANPAVPVVLEVENLIAVDLTETFGTGNENVVDIATLLAAYDGWFSGTVNAQKAQIARLNTDTYLPATNVAYSATSMAGIEKSVTGTGTAAYLYLQMTSPGTLLGTKQMYASAKAKVAEAGCTKICLTYGDPTAPVIIDTVLNPVENTDYMLSGQVLRTLTAALASRQVSVMAYYADAATQTDKTLTASKGIILALTDVFGSGNEPITEDVDLLLSRWTDRWFAGTENLFSTKIFSLYGRFLKPTVNGAYLNLNSDGHIDGYSAVNSAWDKWNYTQYGYGMVSTKAPIYHTIHGVFESDAMFSIRAKYGRWSAGAATSGAHLFGGHVFEAWNNIDTYRLTMMIGKNDREDEACLIVYSPTDCFANPLTTPTEAQAAARITQNAEDRFVGTAYFGRLRIGSDVATEGFVFQKSKMTAYGNIEFDDRSTHGVILASPDGSKFRLMVDDSGVLSAVEI